MANNVLGAEYEERHLFKLSYEKANSVVKDALRMCDFDITSQNPKQNLINAETDWSLRSLGEHIQVLLNKKNDQIYIRFRSRCKSSAQFFDFGKNKKNANQFFKAIDVIL